MITAVPTENAELIVCIWSDYGDGRNYCDCNDYCDYNCCESCRINVQLRE